MTAKRIVDFVTAEPFRPYRIKMTSGKSYDIRHPEMIQVGRTTATVFTWMSDDEEEAKEREQELSILRVEAMEPLEPANKHDQSQ